MIRAWRNIWSTLCWWGRAVWKWAVRIPVPPSFKRGRDWAVWCLLFLLGLVAAVAAITPLTHGLPYWAHLLTGFITTPVGYIVAHYGTKPFVSTVETTVTARKHNHLDRNCKDFHDANTGGNHLAERCLVCNPKVPVQVDDDWDRPVIRIRTERQDLEDELVRYTLELNRLRGERRR